MSPLCAFPEHLDEKEERGKAFKDDNESWFLRWRKKIKPLFAFGPRCPNGLAFSLFPPFVFLRKWREVPCSLFMKRGPGFWRIENETGDNDLALFNDAIPDRWYLSRIQLWCRWHVQIQWPLFFAAHFYLKARDVLEAPKHGDRDGKLCFFYIGAKRDGDRIFWWPAIYVGRNWK